MEKSNIEPYIRSVLKTNLFFLQVEVILNILSNILIFLSATYIFYRFIFDIHYIQSTRFLREIIFVFLVTLFFRIFTNNSYKKSKFDYYENLKSVLNNEQ